MKRMMWMTTFVLVTVMPTAMTLACPMCKDSIPNSDAQEAANVAGGFNASVYYMLIGLCLMVGLVSSVITKGVRDTNIQILNPPEKPE